MSSKNIFKLHPSSIIIESKSSSSLSQSRFLEGDDTRPQLYILKDDTYEPPPHQLVGIIDHGFYILFGRIADVHRDSFILFTKEYKYDQSDTFTAEDGFVVRLIPQSNIETLPFLSKEDCNQEYHKATNKISVSGCKSTNISHVIDLIANQDDVFYIHKQHRMEHRSMGSRAQFYDRNKINVFLNGTVFTGKGSIVVITDSFLDESHGAFYDPNEHLIDKYNVVTSHSKIIAILNGKNGVFNRFKRFEASHGTKVASEAVGYPWLTESGVAPNSKLVFIEGEGTIPYNYIHTLEQAYLLGARSGGISWGIDSRNGEYTYLCYEIDSLHYRLPDLALVVSSGNDDTKLTSPSTAKSVGTVGASCSNELSGVLDSCTYNDVASFTSRGPTLSGRRVPMFLAPGIKTRGARSKSIPYPAHESIFAEDGTSFGPSTIVGEYALIEEKYRSPSSYVSRMFKEAMLLAYARKPTRIVYVDPGDRIESNQEEWNLLSQTYGTPIIPDFDTVNPFVKDWIEYKGVTPLLHQYCLHLEKKQPVRVAIRWNDLNTLSGNLAYRLDLTVFSEDEVRLSNSYNEVNQVVDISGQTIRIRVTSPNKIRYGNWLYYALSTNVTATQIECPGSCVPQREQTNCSSYSNRYCLHDGRESQCALTRCPIGYYGVNCTFPVTKTTKSCELDNGHGYISNKQCIAHECDDGYFISNQSSCSCFKGSTQLDEINQRIGICTDLFSYAYELKSVSFDQVMLGSLESSANSIQHQYTFFIYIILFIILVK